MDSDGDGFSTNNPGSQNIRNVVASHEAGSAASRAGKGMKSMPGTAPKKVGVKDVLGATKIGKLVRGIKNEF
jgi:hypothetical protein